MQNFVAFSEYMNFIKVIKDHPCSVNKQRNAIRKQGELENKLNVMTNENKCQFNDPSVFLVPMATAVVAAARQIFLGFWSPRENSTHISTTIPDAHPRHLSSFPPA